MTFFPPSRLRLLALVVAGTLSIVGLVGCAPAPAQPGELQHVNGGTQISIPALWVDVASNSGGMEYTTVWVGHNSSTPLNVQLDDLAAKGAGSSWKAASASAAAVGTMMSGVDPTDVNFNFDVSGPIDGPSAGAILTVGVLAILKETPLKPSVTMTGTVSPDGSIGTVSGIAAKMRAAADNGFDTVVLPHLATTVQPTGEGERVDTVKYGKSLGLTVALVQNVSQAYEIFTGEPLFENAGPTYTLDLSPSLIAAQASATRAEIQAAADAASAVATGNPLYGDLQQELRSARDAATAGNLDGAFAIAVDVLNQSARYSGMVAVNNQMAVEGVSAAQATFSGQLERHIAAIDRQSAQEAGRISSLSASQTVFLPSALTWLSYSRAVMVALQQGVDALDPNSPSTAEALANAAGIAGAEMAGVEVTFTQNLTMLNALPADSVQPAESAVSHLIGYTQFLVEAGQENENYLTGVFGLEPSDMTSMPVGSLLPVISALSEQAQQISSEVQSDTQEVTDASTALSYYATTSLLVSSTQALGIEGIDLLEGPIIQNPEAVLSSLSAGAEIVHSQSSLIFAKGLQPGFANWSTSWGLEAFQTLSSHDRAGEGTVIALNEIWFDTVALFMLNALQVT